MKSGELTQDIADELKAQYKNCKKVVVVGLDGEKQTFVFRRINREEMDAAIKMSANSMTKALEVQMTSACVFGEPKNIMNDVEVFRAIQSVWGDIQKESAVELGEL